MYYILKWLLWLKTPISFIIIIILFIVFVVLFVSCYICVSYLPLTVIGYNWAMNKILFYSMTMSSFLCEAVFLAVF